MKPKKKIFLINTYQQAFKILDIYKDLKKIPIFYFRYNLINKLSANWLFELIIMLESEYGHNKFKICVNVKKNYGLFISLVEKKIHFLEVQADKEIFTKLKSIAKVNKVSINPDFSIVDLTKSKDVKLKILTYKLL